MVGHRLRPSAPSQASPPASPVPTPQSQSMPPPSRPAPGPQGEPPRTSADPGLPTPTCALSIAAFAAGHPLATTDACMVLDDGLAAAAALAAAASPVNGDPAPPCTVALMCRILAHPPWSPAPCKPDIGQVMQSRATASTRLRIVRVMGQ